MTRTVAQTVTEMLAAAGVRHAYTVPGESFLPLLEALDENERIYLVSTRHESGAAFMAEAEAKLTEVPAVVLASRGPGAANLAIGVHTAEQDQTPMVVLLGQVESGELGREAFQEVDLAAFFAPISKWSVQARRAAEVPSLLAEAIHQATTGRRGPAVVSVPADFWDQPYDHAAVPARRGVSHPGGTPASPPDAVDRAAQALSEILTSARRPVAIAGPGVRVGRDELRQVAAAFNLGVYTAFRRQDCFATDDPHFLGHLGLGVPAELTQALDDADVVLVLGTRLDQITTQDFRYPLPHQHLVLLGRKLPVPAHPGQTTVLDLDVRTVLTMLAETRPEPTPGKRDWTTAHQAALDYSQLGDTSTTQGVHPGEVVATLRRLAPEDAVVTNDAGNFSAFAHRYWRFTTTHRQLGPVNGAMGYAVPAAVAAKLTLPERTVIATVGDGGVLMTGQEIETAVRLGAPIVVIAFRNGCYGTIAMHQALNRRRLAAVDIGDLDLVSWARGLGAEAALLEQPADIEPVLTKALAADQPFLVDVRTDPDIIAPERRLSQLLA